MAKKLTQRQQQILDLIQEHIDKTGIPPTRIEIADAMGFSSTNGVQDHLKALVKKGAISLFAGASRGIRVNPEFLQPAQVQSLATVLPPSTPASSTASNQDLDEGNYWNLPVIGRVAAGNPVLAEENVEKEIRCDMAMFQTKPDYLLRVKGQSMQDIGIYDGDLLAVKKTPLAREGQIVVARIDNEVTVKRFHKTAQGIQLLPENSEFEPIVVDPSHDFAIEGLAVGVIRSF